MSRSCQSATLSKPTCAFAFTTRARPQTRSAVMGLRLCGIAEDPFWPFANGSSASSVSVFWSARISCATHSAVAATVASTASTCACRSRAMTCVRGGVGLEPELLADVLLDERVDVRVRAHRTGDRAPRARELAGRDEAPLGTLERLRPRRPLHAERHRLGVDAVRAPDAERVLELERAPRADLDRAGGRPR